MSQDKGFDLFKVMISAALQPEVARESVAAAAAEGDSTAKKILDDHDRDKARLDKIADSQGTNPPEGAES